MRLSVSNCVVWILALVMAVAPAWAGAPYGPCFTLVQVPAGGSTACPACTVIFPNTYICPAGKSLTITTAFWKCAKAPSGMAGRTQCVATLVPVGTSEECVMYPNTTAIAACLILADKCVDICAGCLVPGAGWPACVGCAVCVLVAGGACTGCSVRLCLPDPATSMPYYRYVGTLQGDSCDGI